jgi:hypothetical protein
VRTSKLRLEVQDGQYWLADDGSAATGALPPPGGSNGLIGVIKGLAVILTGTQFGGIELTVESGDSDPGLHVDGWDDVVEVSFSCSDDAHQAGITSGGLGPDEFQDLIPGNSGTYRIRVHARGRDAGADRDVVDGAPVEEHRLQAWPAPPAREIVHKATDKYGSMLRDEETLDPDPRYPGGEHVELRVGQPITTPAWVMASFDGIDVHARGCRIKFRIVVDVSGMTSRQEKRARRAVDGHEGAVLPQHTGAGRLRVTAAFRNGTHVDSQASREPAPVRGPEISISYSSNYPVGDTQVAEESFWLWPLPPAEEFPLTLEWPAVGIPPTTITIDGAAVAAAASRVQAH